MMQSSNDQLVPDSAPRLKSAELQANDPELVDKWNGNANVRALELEANDDPAYRALTNLILRSASEHVVRESSILDAGCGLGYISNSLARSGYRVTGIDPSGEQITYAARKFPRVQFICRTIEDYASAMREPLGYAAVIANMVLHTTPDLYSFLSSAKRLLIPGGYFVATVPNPFSPKNTHGSLVDISATDGYLVRFQIHDRDPHPELVPHFPRDIGEYSEETYRAGFENVHIATPPHVGPGRDYDIVVLFAFRPTSSEI
jgi:SAM-dependent methyltransferase